MWKEFLSPIIIAFLGIFGGGAGIFWYLVNKPKTNADINKINSEVSVTYAEEWRKLFEQNKSEIGVLRGEMKILHEENVVMQDKYENHIRDLESKLKEKDRIHALIIQEKDGQITELGNQITSLGRQITDLSERLRKYENMEVKVSVAKDAINLAVNDTLDTFNK